MEAVLYFPVLFSTHSIRLDGTVLDQGEGGAGVSFTLTPGDHLLTVETASDRGYYSGMYHPPALLLFALHILLFCEAVLCGRRVLLVSDPERGPLWPVLLHPAADRSVFR